MAPITQTIVIEGTLPASAAAWSTSSIKYLPFDVPDGVSSIHVHREVQPIVKHTVAMMLYDARGLEQGFRGYQGQVNVATDFTVTADPETTTGWYLPGPLTPGRWHIGQWYVEAHEETLRYNYTVTLTFGEPASEAGAWPAYSPGVAAPRSGWYAGGLHNHTLYSYDAQIGGTPHSVSSLMRKFADAGFSFLAITDHNQPRSHMDAPAAAAGKPDTLLILGNEITTLHGHANTLFIPPGTSFDFRIDPGDGQLPLIIDRVHGLGGIVVVNHPYQKCADCWWRYPEHEWDAADAIEVWNRPWSDINRKAVDMWDGLLKQGRRFAAVGGADYHRGDAPLVPVTWVHVPELSCDGVKQAILRRHVFLSESPAGPLIYMNTLDGLAMVGDSVRARAGESVGMIVRAVGASGCGLRLVTRYGEHTTHLTSDDHAVEHSLSPGPFGNYLRAEIVRPNGDVAALTNPIFVTQG